MTETHLPPYRKRSAKGAAEVGRPTPYAIRSGGNKLLEGPVHVGGWESRQMSSAW